MKRMVKIRILLSIILFLPLLSICNSFSSEVAKDSLIPKRPGAKRPDLPDYLPDKLEKKFPSPSFPEITPHLGKNDELGFVLQGVKFEGNTVFTHEQLSAVAVPFVSQRVGFIELEELRYRLTRHYTDQGFINSGVILKPKQSVDDGVVTFEVNEGRLNEIRVVGNEKLTPDYITQRLWPDKQQPFNTQRLQQNFQLLLRDQFIERMDGRLMPGLGAGQAILDLQVVRATPYELFFSLDNSRAPSSGAERGRLSGVLHNLTGFGDSLELASEFSEGANEWEVAFNFPLNASGTLLSLRYDNTNSHVIEEPLDAIDIENEYESYELSLSHPLWKELQGHFITGATLAVKKNHSYLFGQPFPFSPSDDSHGRSAVSALRLWQDYQLRRSDWVFAARSSLSIGLDWFDATIHSGDITDSRFVAWLAQLQYAQRVWEDAQVIIRADIQLSSDKLLALEKFSLGGINTV